MTNTIRIATRKSKLALWQANHVAQLLQQKGFGTEFVLVVTKGDRILDVPLADIGGKGLFLKEIEDTLLQRGADIAVHSMKDVPSQDPEGLVMAGLLEREDPRDALIGATSLAALPEGATVGTSSLRRHAQVIASRPDITIKTLRGNVDTRLQKLFDGQYDGIVLATAGLIRLGLNQHIGQRLDFEHMLPAVAQGCVGVQCRSDNPDLIQLLGSLGHRPTTLAVIAERKANEALGGSCHAPIAVHGTWAHNQLQLEGLAGNLKGQLIRTQVQAAVEDEQSAQQLGMNLAQNLFKQGARELLQIQ